MKGSILHDLYCGDIIPLEHGFVPSREYSALTHKLDDLAEYLKKLLPPEEQKKFEEMQNMWVDIDAIEDVDLFEYSFALGARMMVEVFAFQGKLIGRT